MDDIKDKIKSIPISQVARWLGIECIGKKKNIRCPFPSHNDKNPSMSINDSKGTYHCFGCGEKGDHFDLIQSIKDTDFKGAIKWAEEQGLIRQNYDYTHIKTIVSKTKKTTDNLKKDSSKLSDIYEYFIGILPQATESDYLVKGRCLSPDVLKLNNVKNIDKDYKQKLLNKFSETELEESGLFSRSEKGNIYFFFWDCDYIFPFYRNDRVIYLQGVFKERSKKYKNLPRLKKPLLYLPKQFSSYSKEVCITEGIIDTLSVLTLGKNSVSIIDANSLYEKESELNALKSFSNILLGDSDVPGIKLKRLLYKYMTENGFSVSNKSINKLANSFKIDKHIKDANELLKELKQ